MTDDRGDRPARRLALVRSIDDASATPYDEATHVAGVQRRNEDVFTALVRAYIDPLTTFAFGCLGDEDAAHDVVQEVFARVWQLGAAWNPTSGIAAYLFAAVRHRAYSVIRANQSRERMQRAVTTDMGPTAMEQDPYLDLTLVAFVQRELEHLTERQRDVLRLRFEQGHTMAQVAAILGIDLRTAERVAARGFTALRTKLDAFRKRLG